MEGGQISAGSITAWFRDHFAKDLLNSDSQAYQVLAEEAKAAPPGSDGLIVLDFWQGNRTPFRDSSLSGAIWGLRLHHNRGHIYRAVLEAVGYGTKNVLQVFEQNGFQTNKIVACGGVVNNPLWLQIQES